MCLKRNLLAFVILFVVLVFSLFSMSGVQASPQNSENENIRVHEGDLVIEEGENFILENERLLVDGNVIAKSYSKLVLKNSTLMVVQEYKSQYSIEMRAHSKGRIVDSTIKPVGGVHKGDKSLFKTQLMFNLFYSDLKIFDSRVSARIDPLNSSTTQIENSLVAHYYWTPVTTAIFEDTLIGSFVFDYKQVFTKPGKITFRGLKTNETLNFSRKTVENGLLKFENSKNRGWLFNLTIGMEKKIRVENSDLDLVWVNLPPTENVIHIEVPDGYAENFSLSESISGYDLSYDFILVDTKFKPFKLVPLGTKAVIENSRAMIHPEDKSSLVVRNSEAWAMNVYGTEKIKFIDSIVCGPFKLILRPEMKGGKKIMGTVFGPGGTGQIIFENTSLENCSMIKVACKEYHLKGEIEINSPNSVKQVHWAKGRIIRHYLLVVKSPDGKPASEVSVSLLDNENRKVWTGETDENGRATFTIDLNENNYDKNWRVEADYPAQEKIDRKVNFLCDTPIVVMPKAKAEPEFSITDLSAAKGEVKKGETTTVSVKVTNTGGKKGTYTAELSINGEVKTQSVTLKPDESEKVTFKISREKAGTYEINVGELSKSLNVRKPEKPEKGIPWLIIGGVIVVVIAISAFVLYRRK